jgi:hypothetical protein
MKYMKKVDLWNGILFLTISAVLAVGSLELEIGELHKPGPGFLPLYLSVLLGFLSVILIIKVFFEKRDTFTFQKLLSEHINWKPIILVLILMVCWGVLLEPLGYPLVTFFFILLIIRFADPQPWMKSLFWAAIGSVGTHFIFVWMQLRLPKGEYTQIFLRMLTGGQ